MSDLMAVQAVMKHVEYGVPEEARWDGREIRRKGRKLIVTQRILKAYRKALLRSKKLHCILESALTKGAIVEPGTLDTGIFTEKKREPNWRELFIAKGGDAQKAIAKTEFKESDHLRVFVAGDKPRGTRILPKGV